MNDPTIHVEYWEGLEPKEWTCGSWEDPDNTLSSLFYVIVLQPCPERIVYPTLTTRCHKLLFTPRVGPTGNGPIETSFWGRVTVWLIYLVITPHPPTANSLSS